MKRFFQPTKGGRIAAQQREDEKHTAQMGAFRRREDIFRSLVAPIQPFLGNYTRNFLRSMGVNPITGRYEMTGQDLANLGRTGAVNRAAEAETAAMLAQQGADPATIAKITANMRNQNLMSLGQVAMQQEQQAMQNAMNLAMGFAGTQANITPVGSTNAVVEQPFNWGATIANAVGNYMMTREMNRLRQQPQSQPQLSRQQMAEIASKAAIQASRGLR